MIQTKSNKIRSAEKYLIEFKQNEEVVIGLKLTKDLEAIVKEYGGEIEGGSVFTPATINKETYRNKFGYLQEVKPTKLEGKLISFYAPNYNQDGDHLVSYVRRVKKRVFIEGEAYDLAIVENNNEKFVIVNDYFKNNKIDYKRITDAINLILSMFKKADLLKKDFERPINTKQVDWEMLRKDNWKRGMKEYISGTLNYNESRTKIILTRQDFLNDQKPIQRYKDVNIFYGYIAYVFKNYVVLDSIIYGNATYIFKKDGWEEKTKNTKREVFTQHLYEARIIHWKKDWEQQVKTYTN